MHVYRFLLRLWGTRHAKSRSFRHRCKFVWGSRLSESVSYKLLEKSIEYEKPNDKLCGGA